MADAVEPVRYGVLEESPHELVDGERHHFGLAVIAVVLPGEVALAVGEPGQAGVGDGDAVGIAAEIGQHRLGTGEGRFGVDDPFDAAQRGKALSEGGGFARPRACRRSAGRQPRRPPAAVPGTGHGTVGTRRAPAGRTPDGTPPTASGRAIGRRRGRCSADADDGATSDPRCAARRPHRSRRRDGVDRRRRAHRLGRGTEQNGVDDALVLERDLRRRQPAG